MSADHYCTPVLVHQNDREFGFFVRNWEEYKSGFGEPTGNYWIGNGRLHTLTKHGHYKLKIDLQEKSTGIWHHVGYRLFKVGDEMSNYKLKVGGFSTDSPVKDSFGKLDGIMFSTYDRDNDGVPNKNEAAIHGGGYWYSKEPCSLNASDMCWPGLELKKTRIMLECK